MNGSDDVIWERLIPGWRPLDTWYDTYRRVGEGRRTAFENFGGWFRGGRRHSGV